MSDRGPVRWLDRLSLRPPTAGESVRWEIEHHLEETTDRLIQQGWAPDAARLEARRRFGVRRYGPALRRMERGRMTVRKGNHLWDFAGGSVARVLRGARRDRAFTAAVMITLALGIGANATMVGIVDRLLLRPPDHVVEPDAVRRVFVERPFVGRLTTSSTITVPDAMDLKAHSAFAAVGIYNRSAMTLGSGENAQRVFASMSSHDLFSLLGVEPLAGRFFGEADDRVGADPTAVISQELWARRTRPSWAESSSFQDERTRSSALPRGDSRASISRPWTPGCLCGWQGTKNARGTEVAIGCRQSCG
jgi:hypothetical protein